MAMQIHTTVIRVYDKIKDEYNNKSFSSHRPPTFADLRKHSGIPSTSNKFKPEELLGENIKWETDDFNMEVNVILGPMIDEEQSL